MQPQDRLKPVTRLTPTPTENLLSLPALLQERLPRIPRQTAENPLSLPAPLQDRLTRISTWQTEEIPLSLPAQLQKRLPRLPARLIRVQVACLQSSKQKHHRQCQNLLYRRSQSLVPALLQLQQPPAPYERQMTHQQPVRPNRYRVLQAARM